MLEDHERDKIQPLLMDSIFNIQQYRAEHQCSLADAVAHGHGAPALTAYYELTGFMETNPAALWHHRVSLYGPPCSNCGKPLRTPRASYCPACGTARVPN